MKRALPAANFKVKARTPAEWGKMRPVAPHSGRPRYYDTKFLAVAKLT